VADENATESNTLLVAFLHRVDHDLRTPLGTMAAALELLSDEGPHSIVHAESVAVIQRQIARVHALAQELREFAQRVERQGGDARLN
jgi:signal transduction histidine kinase